MSLPLEVRGGPSARLPLASIPPRRLYSRSCWNTCAIRSRNILEHSKSLVKYPSVSCLSMACSIQRRSCVLLSAAHRPSLIAEITRSFSQPHPNPTNTLWTSAARSGLPSSWCRGRQTQADVIWLNDSPLPTYGHEVLPLSI